MDQITKAIEEASQQLVAVSNTLFTVLLLLSIVPYILFAVGIRSVASQYGIRNKWMAWIPIARKYLLAQIADIRRAQVGKPKILKAQFEILALVLFACAYVLIKSSNIAIIIIGTIVAAIWSYHQAFCYYYFYRLCDRENATIYFLLGLVAKPLNSFFVFHCR